MLTGLNDFKGLWHVSRRIEDIKSGGQGRFEGAARFEPDQNGLRYAEEGQLQLDGQPSLTASRVYFWRPVADGISVYFEDGRPFHRFSLSVSPEASHWCDPDTYKVAYSFSAWPEWTAVWAVTGPRKDYVMASHYRRPRA